MNSTAAISPLYHIGQALVTPYGTPCRVVRVVRKSGYYVYTVSIANPRHECEYDESELSAS